MYNWSVDEKKFKKNHPKEYRLWRITQMINYGLEEGERLDKEEVKKAWPKIKTKIDRYARRTMEFFLFNKLNKLSLDSPIIENPKEKEMIMKCPICRFEEAKEKGFI